MGIRNTEKRKLITDPKLKHLEYGKPLFKTVSNSDKQ